MAEVVIDKPRYGVRLECSDDGVFRLLLDGEVAFESKVRSAVEIEFNEAVEERSANVRAARSRDEADFTVRGVIAAGNQAKAAARNAGRYRGKGG